MPNNSPTPTLVGRCLAERVREALADTRVVAVVGPRQAGKSTLATELVAEYPASGYVSLDDLEVRAAAAADPAGFVDDRPGLLAIDEVQRVPELLLAIKSSVDRDRRPGRFLVTGSSQLSANRDVSETLTGRIERLTLWPFSQSEMAGRCSTFLDRLFSAALPIAAGELSKREYLERAVVGGFPEAQVRAGRRREAWFDSYVETVVEREGPGIAATPRTADLPRLLRLVAARHGGVLNIADLASDAQLPRTSVQRYLDVLDAIFLTVRLPAWAPNLSQREIRAPKIFVADPGLASHLRGADVAMLTRPELAAGLDGPLIEGLVVAELIRQSGWSERRVRLSHYRDRDRAEIDVIIESGGEVAAVEVKGGATADRAAVRNLTMLRDRLGKRFVTGVVLHTGPRATQLGDRLFSLPISVLWD